MDKTIKECIEYAYEQGFILYGNYVDNLNELEDLENDSIQLHNMEDEDNE